jgi:hypothetical protein
MIQDATRGFLPLILVLTMIGTGCGEPGGETVCDQAGQHVAQCMGQPAPGPAGSCDENNANLSQELLDLDCGGVRAYMLSQSKADRWGFGKGVTSDEPICDPSNPEDTACEAYCNSIEVEFVILGIKFPSCLYHSSCDYAGEEMGRCQCKYVACLGGGGEPEPEEPSFDDEPAPDQP